MNKITNFFRKQKKVVIGLITVSAASILRYSHPKYFKFKTSVYLYKYFTKKSSKASILRPKKQTPVPKVNIPEPKKQLTQKDLLTIISKIKKLCNENLKTLRNKYRVERRKVFYDEEAYQQLIEEYDSKLLQILEATSERVFKEYKITHADFDDGVKAYINDEEISSAVDSMATVEEEYFFSFFFPPEDKSCEAPLHITKEVLLEIFNYNNKRCSESVFESNKNFEYLNTRIQDEIYFKYRIEVEELSACYKKFNCESDPDFLPKIDEMQKSMSTYFYA